MGDSCLDLVIDLDAVENRARKYYRDGDFYCSEAVVKVIKDTFKVDISDDIIAMASGFPVGIGQSGCTCGAISGAVMSIGLLFGRNKPKDTRVQKAMALSAEIHDYFKDTNKCTCCRVLTKGMDFGKGEHLEQCIRFTGLMARKTAEIACRELDIKTK